MRVGLNVNVKVCKSGPRDKHEQETHDKRYQIGDEGAAALERGSAARPAVAKDRAEHTVWRGLHYKVIRTR